MTQNPRDLPETVLAQLGCRIQHALRAYTPTERKGVKAAAQSFRPNPGIDTEAAITELGTGEALVSTLDLKGRADRGGAHADPAAILAAGSGDGRRARGGAGAEPGGGKVRRPGRPGVGL